jgi:hypothetical protein
MGDRKPTRSNSTGIREVKLLITTGALAATMLGWAILALRGEASEDVDPIEAAPPAVPPAFAFLAEPLPTVAAPGMAAGNPAAVEFDQAGGLRSVSAPPPVQIITITKPSSGGSGGGGGGGRTQSSR